ncbi:2,3-dihydro-2,3-dihydroxybenzoate dehydrogenase [Algibacillus agarilyticus]|uniref:2,3-dihydro-2,3-dihydroxybenzoate dehydrogenase n=1 Tax=Algibacillus agarilyticus TaxID=2234133 RepID=UPI0013009A9E|nr:2,3-dihydro-2,3-dihydroxybenzoate dehydrogenase [Algibacillus agarilyticus]
MALNTVTSTSFCLITGAAKGIGAAVARLLAKQQHALILIDKDLHQLQELKSELMQYSTEPIQCYGLDVTQYAAVATLIDEFESNGLCINHLVNCAGILHTTSVLKTDLHHVTQTFAVNTFAAFHFMQQVAKNMQKRGAGSIVVIGSNAASVPRVNMSAYCASKAALHALVRCFALELAGTGVRCNIVSPGSTLTAMQTAMWDNPQGELNTLQGDLAQFKLGIPLHKLATVDDIAQSVSFLLSDAASHITMHDLRVDGGATLGAI